jgi:hypothetical protein
LRVGHIGDGERREAIGHVDGRAWALVDIGVDAVNASGVDLDL